ncbi:hypothetical protein FB45DRAFT_902376 [Roridomyces roridus]|uniref:BRCT domain-containing protein n=1 Tax=Roridomyces roridus TaxID=1738132 RepID=A0AAD7C3G2_9AGAR|nr:hypothetical protein FB45DRAFT_902376 [Roridomyces roridus]
MHRRGNKKIPNVRLRPAAPNATAKARASPEPSCWAQDSQLIGSDDTVMPSGSCPRPFKGVIVCATGVLDKPGLFKLALELGATSVSAFTDRVTHLVAENHGGAKYLCALERKIPILSPSWIIDSHRIWQHGDDVDLEQSVAAHRLPIFSGVTLCVSGISELLRRTKINKAVTANGGTYVKALERPVRVTHLLCAGDEETDKMRYAEKFNRAGEANPPIQLVWEEWFWDSIVFGGRFDEARYHVRQPRPERRAAPEITPEIANPLPIPSADDEEEEDELAAVQRLPAVTLQLWESLLKGRGYEVAAGGVMLSPGKAREMVMRKQAQGAVDEMPEEPKSVLSSFRRSNSFIVPRATATAAREPSAGPSRLPFGRTTSGDSNPEPPPPSSVPPRFFSGYTFFLLGETDSANVRDAILDAGGTLVGSASSADLVLVRLVSGSALYQAETCSSARTRYRTECWLEQCLFTSRLCAPDDHVSFTPLSVKLPIPAADQITLSFSTLDASEACWVRRLLKALGITLAPAFSRQTTHLLCPSGTGAKYTRAREWGVPVVNMDWLAAMAHQGAVPPVDAFLLRPSPPPPARPSFGEAGPVLRSGPANDSPSKRVVPRTPSPSKRPTSTPVVQPILVTTQSSAVRRAATFDGVGRGREEPVAALVRAHSSSSPARVPSSSSPSPLRRGRGPSVSPVQVPDHRTKALQESLVSLLGKRPATPEGDTRAGKRGRPHRSKPQSRQHSDTRVEEDVFGGERRRSLSPGPDDGALEGQSLGDEQSLRVMYEDPEQREELRRLARLIGEEPVEATTSARTGRPRRSTRRSGTF